MRKEKKWVKMLALKAMLFSFISCFCLVTITGARRATGAAAAIEEDDISSPPVSCGSILKLVHQDTGFSLHSHGIKWGSGSGQQSVTAHGGKDDQNSLWLVKEAYNAFPCEVGSPIKCGDTVRLEHIRTGRNLHTHLFQSPLSRNQEVSAFGEGGDGDSGDNFVVVCTGANTDRWIRKAPIKLKNADTSRYLISADAHKFVQQNCPNCPIVGQLEVACSNNDASWALWYADQGFYINKT